MANTQLVSGRAQHAGTPVQPGAGDPGSGAVSTLPAPSDSVGEEVGRREGGGINSDPQVTVINCYWGERQITVHLVLRRQQAEAASVPGSGNCKTPPLLSICGNWGSRKPRRLAHGTCRWQNQGVDPGRTSVESRLGAVPGQG